MESNLYAQKVIKEYVEKYLCTPHRLRRLEFAQESYARWAANELLIELQRRKHMPPLIVMEEFRNKMDRYSLKKGPCSWIFSVAKDTAETLIDLLIG